MTDTQSTKREGEDVSDIPQALKRVLLGRRKEHVEALEKIDDEVSEIQKELSRRINDARAQTPTH